jgi:hypothetical protein
MDDHGGLEHELISASWGGQEQLLQELAFVVFFLMYRDAVVQKFAGWLREPKLS